MKSTNPSGATIHFDTKYFSFKLDTGERLASVSKVLRGFFPAFNAPEIAKKCLNKPEYANMTVGDIVALWKAEGKRATSEGNNVHDMLNCYTKKKAGPKPISMSCVRLFKCGLKSLGVLLGKYQLIDSEMIVFSESLKTAGFIDLLLKGGDDIIIIDWKTNREIKTSNNFEKAFSPIQHLDNCNLVQYKLHLNVLRKILLHENYYPDANIKMGIVHLQQSGEPINIQVEPLDKEVEGIIEKFNRNGNI